MGHSMHNYNETYYRLKQTCEPLIALGSYQGGPLIWGTDFNILAFRKRPQTALVAFGNVCSESVGGHILLPHTIRGNIVLARFGTNPTSAGWAHKPRLGSTALS